MKKQRFLVFLFSTAFGLSMIFLASTWLVASTGQTPVSQGSDQQCCPFYRSRNLSVNGSSCPFLQRYGKNCPALNGAASAGECPALRQQRNGVRKTAGSNCRIYLLSNGSDGPVFLLKDQSRPSYILILTPVTNRADRGKLSNEIRI
jgi:hypothetical protein